MINLNFNKITITLIQFFGEQINDDFQKETCCAELLRIFVFGSFSDLKALITFGTDHKPITNDSQSS